MTKDPSNGELKALSRRERRVLRYLVQGFTMAEVAGSLGLAIPAVEHLYSNICRKLHLHDRPAVQEYAVAIGLVSRNGQ